MKNIFTIFAALTFFALGFVSCENPVDNGNTNDDTGKTEKPPSLTIKNESSYVLTEVKFSGLSFAAADSTELPPTSQAVKQLSQDSLNKAGYISFVRKDIGIVCRTDAVITLSDTDETFTFTDQTVVVEQGNTENRKTLAQITFISQLGIEYGGLNVARNDTVNLGEAIIGSAPKQTEFVLKNTGVGKLLLNGNEPVKISGADVSGVFSLVQPLSPEIAPGEALSFKITFTPQAAQVYNGTVTVSTNDPSGDFGFTVNAAGVASKSIIGVWNETTEIPQNGTINAGEVLISQTKNIDVLLKNTGQLTLQIDTANISISGGNASAFSILTMPGGNISSGSDSRFIIQCAPTTAGENNAILTIPTNDSSRNPAVVYLKVTAVQGVAVLELSQGTTDIANNAITPLDFGSAEIGTNKNLTFTIKNTGNIPLELTGAPVVESSNAVFTVPAQPANKTIAPGASVSFIIRYTPAGEQESTATISMLNNSGDLQFIFTVKGTGFAKKPQITVTRGSATVNVHGTVDFGTIAVGKTKDISFTIGNSGEANLTFVTVDSNRVNLTDNAAGLFSITSQPAASTTVTPGGSTAFTVRFSPTTVGNNFTATVLIKTNSRDNDEFIFAVKGNARAASTESRLSGLQFTKGKLDPRFNTNINGYTLNIDSGENIVKVTPTSTDTTISDIKVNGKSQNSGAQSEDIILATTASVTIMVTAEDGTTTSTYTVAINRIIQYSSTALSSLYVLNMDGTVEKDILPALTGSTGYWDALPDETLLAFKVIPANSNATVKLNNTTIENNVYTNGYPLTPGSTATKFTFTVISQDGENQRTIVIESAFRGSNWTKVGTFSTNTGSGNKYWYPKEHTVVVHNNQFIMTVTGNVFVSSDGANWIRAAAFPDDIWHYRSSTVVFNNTIYNIGGFKKDNAGDMRIAPIVSHSTNGTLYTLAPSVTGLTNGITNHTSVVFNGSIYTMGGETTTLYQTNAVWASTNGTAWTRLTEPGWGARAGHAGVVHNNKMFVMGGAYNDGNSEYRDVWSSTNGTTWIQETSNAAWTGRNDHTVNANNAGMWLIGGHDGYFRNDVWFSRDGKTWTQVLQTAPFPERACHAAAIKDGYLYIFGGVNGSLEKENDLFDVWRTYIGE